MRGFKLIFFKLYVFFLALWMGAGVYTLAESEGWYDDPVSYVDHRINYPVPGAQDIWPTLTLCLSITSLLSMLLIIGYHGLGRRTAIVSFIGSFIIILFTYFYFFPVSAKIFDEAGTYPEDQIVSMSRTWIISNYIRMALVVIVFFSSLIALSKFKSNRQKI